MKARTRAATLLLTPFFVLFTAVMVVPIGYAVWLSLFTEKQSGLGFGGTRPSSPASTTTPRRWVTGPSSRASASCSGTAVLHPAAARRGPRPRPPARLRARPRPPLLPRERLIAFAIKVPAHRRHQGRRRPPRRKRLLLRGLRPRRQPLPDRRVQRRHLLPLVRQQPPVRGPRRPGLLPGQRRRRIRLPRLRLPGRGEDSSASSSWACSPPTSALALPMYLLASEVGIVNTYWAVLIPVLVNPFGVYLSRALCRRHPRRGPEAARIDGASRVARLLVDRPAHGHAGLRDRLPLPVHRRLVQLSSPW
ncbi:hypothetical protein STANM309S_03354 [Streptomyces tanashiensis]